MKKQELTQELLKQLIDYDPDTGVFTWRERPLSMFKYQHDCKGWNKKYANKEAGSIKIDKLGAICMQITLLSKVYKLSRLTFLYVNGAYPINDIDCIDGDFTNLKWKNIRECTRTDTRYKTIKSKGDVNIIGVHFCNRERKYISKITVKGKSITLGQFNTPEEAHQAYVNAKRQISPEFCMN